MERVFVKDVSDLQNLNPDSCVEIEDIRDEFILPSGLECAVLSIKNSTGITNIPEDVKIHKLILQGKCGILPFGDKKQKPIAVKNLVIVGMKYIPRNIKADSLSIMDSDIEDFDLIGSYDTLEFIDCRKLKYIAPARTKVFFISNCDNITNLDNVTVSKEVSILNAPKLKSVDFLRNSKTIYYNNIILYNIPKLTTFTHRIVTMNLQIYNTGLTTNEMIKMRENNIIMNLENAISKNDKKHKLQ